MPTTSNFGWTTPADTDLVKDGAAAIRTLGNGIDTSFVDLKGGTTDQVLTKNSNTDLDFKWVTSDDANAIQNAIVDAKGDIIAATAADTPARLPVGTNDQRLVAASGEATGLKYVSDTQNTVVDAKGDLIVGTAADTVARLAVGTNGYTLVADSAETTGLKWQAASSSGMTLITRQTITNSSGTNIDSVFTSTYRSYYIVVEDAVTGSSPSSSADFQCQLRYGSTTQTSDYKYQEIDYGTTYSSTERNGVSQILLSKNIGDSNQSTAVWMQLTQVGNTSERAYFINNNVDAYSGIPLMCSGYVNALRTYTGIRFLVASGNFSATISIYGLAKS